MVSCQCAGKQFCSHERFIRDVEGTADAVKRSLDETEALVECGFAEDKDGTIACAPAMINAAPYQFAADARRW